MTRKEIKAAFPTATRIVANSKNWMIHFASESDMVQSSKKVKFNHLPVFSGNYITVSI